MPEFQFGDRVTFKKRNRKCYGVFLRLTTKDSCVVLMEISSNSGELHYPRVKNLKQDPNRSLLQAAFRIAQTKDAHLPFRVEVRAPGEAWQPTKQYSDIDQAVIELRVTLKALKAIGVRVYKPRVRATWDSEDVVQFFAIDPAL